MSAGPASLLPVALDAIALASDLVRSRPPAAITVKGDRDMASDIDYAVEDAVRAYLREKTPDIGFLGEEAGSADTAATELQWVLDPVDGTANFVHGIPLCAISLGLVHGNRPVAGVIDLPFLGSRYSAAEGDGAHNGTRHLQVRRPESLTEAIVSIGDYAFGPNAEPRNRTRLRLTGLLAAHVQRVRMLGSAAIDLAWVAEGKLDAAVMLANKPWDTAAGVVIAREAGAHVLDIDGSQHTLDSTATIAASPALAHQITALAREAAAGL